MAKTLIPFKDWYPGYKGAPPAGAGGPVYITEEEYKALAPPVTPTPKVTTESIEQSLKEIRSKIPTIKTGISALAEIDTTTAPAIDTNAGDIGALGAGLVGTDKQMQDLIKALAKQSEEAAKRADVAQKGILATLTKRKEEREEQPSVAELTKTTLAEYGLTPESVQKVQGLIGQLAAYGQQAIDLEAQKQKALGLSEQAGMPVTYIRGEQSLIERQYNSKISAKAAQAAIVSQQIQMERGLWDDARVTTNMIVSAETYDQQQVLADLDWVYDTYKDLYVMATAEEKTTWDRAYTVAQNELTKQQDEWNTKLGLNQRAAEMGVSLGWDSTYMASHTIEELNTEYSKRVSEAVAAGKVADVDIEPEQYKAGLIADKADGMTYEQAISSYGSVIGLDYIDRIYRKGKYFLQDVDITEAGEEIALKEEIAEWESKYEKGEVERWEVDDDDYIIVYYGTQETWWGLGKKEKILFEYNIEK